MWPCSPLFEALLLALVQTRDGRIWSWEGPQLRVGSLLRAALDFGGPRTLQIAEEIERQGRVGSPVPARATLRLPSPCAAWPVLGLCRIPLDVGRAVAKVSRSLAFAPRVVLLDGGRARRMRWLGVEHGRKGRVPVRCGGSSVPLFDLARDSAAQVLSIADRIAGVGSYSAVGPADEVAFPEPSDAGLAAALREALTSRPGLVHFDFPAGLSLRRISPLMRGGIDASPVSPTDDPYARDPGGVASRLLDAFYLRKVGSAHCYSLLLVRTDLLPCVLRILLQPWRPRCGLQGLQRVLWPLLLGWRPGPELVDARDAVEEFARRAGRLASVQHPVRVVNVGTPDALAGLEKGLVGPGGPS